MVKPVYVDIIYPQVCRTQILVVPRHLDTADMRPVASLRNTSEPFMENLVRNGIHCPRTVIQMQDSYLSIVVACTEQKLVLIVSRKVTSPHAVGGSGIHKFKISVRQNSVAANTSIRYRVKILSVVRNRYV